MKLEEILKIRLDSNRIKLIRNSAGREIIQELMGQNLFDLYQSFQKKDVFRDTDYIVSFLDTEGTKALLYGVFKNNGVEEINEFPSELNIIRKEEGWGNGPYFKYDLEKVDLLKDLEGRLVIEWGKATLSWHQWRIDKEIIEILPEGYLKKFPGYENIVLTFDELAKLINNPDANRQWKMMLSNVYGIYLILDTKTGQQYVGSASGEGGIWGRWSDYVRTKHGNNKLLIELVDKDPEYYKNFQFSILSVLPKSTLREQVIQMESIIKKKLGANAFGLNAN